MIQTSREGRDKYDYTFRLVLAAGLTRSSSSGSCSRPPASLVSAVYWLLPYQGAVTGFSYFIDDMLPPVIKRREASGSGGSFLDIVLDENDKLGLYSHQLYFLGGVMMEGGSDTSSSVIISFVQAITKWQKVRRGRRKRLIV